MSRKLTTVEIKGTVFEVDAFREVLRQADDRHNTIPFQVFDKEGDGYRLLYDPLTRNIPRSKKAVLADPDRYCWVILPALMELDPEGIALRYEIPLEVLCPDPEHLIPKEVIAEIKQVSLSARSSQQKK
ncbi:MAG: hypothetical protein BGO31_05425 [Bacteroidetes bacterium 43-16]|uniref:hypothetical protein n=1 Tax=uncultured Dysgonomonas sp. TaxID=206096 RepID=UPI00092679FB|nr:hypothetical protein [uncultured Dysgonomonas sp.]OJV52272.1 MAG: hypothetical protein BGO31_05425 [Bacteroidetes bacterium 43-16]